MTIGMGDRVLGAAGVFYANASAEGIVCETRRDLARVRLDDGDMCWVPIAALVNRRTATPREVALLEVEAGN